MGLPVEFTVVLILAYKFLCRKGVLVWLTLHVVNPGIVTSFPFSPPLVAIQFLTILSAAEHKIKREGLKASGSFTQQEAP